MQMDLIVSWKWVSASKKRPGCTAVNNYSMYYFQMKGKTFPWDAKNVSFFGHQKFLLQCQWRDRLTDNSKPNIFLHFRSNIRKSIWTLLKISEEVCVLCYLSDITYKIRYKILC